MVTRATARTQLPIIIALATMLFGLAPLLAAQEQGGSEQFAQALEEYGFSASEARSLSSTIGERIPRSQLESMSGEDFQVAARALAGNRGSLRDGQMASIAIELAATAAELRRVGVGALDRANVAARGLRSALGSAAANGGAPAEAGERGLAIANAVRGAVTGQIGRAVGREVAQQVRERLQERGIGRNGVPGQVDAGGNDIPGGDENEERGGSRRGTW